MSFVLITVPHATQPATEKRRASDLAALGAAEALNARLNDRGVATLFLKGDVPRQVCDLNRHGACSTGAGQFKARYVVALHREPALVMDMHSFPDVVTWGLSFRPSAVVLYEADSARLAQSLVTALGSMTSAVAGLRGKAGENYIVIEAARHRVPALLLEVHEERDYRPIIDATAAWIERVIK